MDATVAGMLIGATTEDITNDDGENTGKTWTKLVLLGTGGETFICSLDNKMGNEVVENVSKYAKKDVLLGGTLYRYKGILKFRAKDIQVIK